MAQEFSFDVVSNADMQEVSNAVQQARKELTTRFDFKGSESEIELSGNEIVLVSDDEQKLRSVRDILEDKMVRRKVPIKALDYQKIEPASGSTVRQKVRIIEGIETEKAKAIVKALNSAKIKVQASIQGEQVRVAGKKKDDLQSAIDLLRKEDFGIPLQFVNYR